MNAEWWEINIHVCYLAVKIAFVPIPKKNQQIWRHNPGSHDVTDQLWWLHNAKTENTILGEDGKMSDWFNLIN